MAHPVADPRPARVQAREGGGEGADAAKDVRHVELLSENQIIITGGCFSREREQEREKV